MASAKIYKMNKSDYTANRLAEAIRVIANDVKPGQQPTTLANIPEDLLRGMVSPRNAARMAPLSTALSNSLRSIAKEQARRLHDEHQGLIRGLPTTQEHLDQFERKYPFFREMREQQELEAWKRQIQNVIRFMEKRNTLPKNRRGLYEGNYVFIPIYPRLLFSVHAYDEDDDIVVLRSTNNYMGKFIETKMTKGRLLATAVRAFDPLSGRTLRQKMHTPPGMPANRENNVYTSNKYRNFRYNSNAIRKGAGSMRSRGGSVRYTRAELTGEQLPATRAMTRSRIVPYETTDSS